MPSGDNSNGEREQPDTDPEADQEHEFVIRTKMPDCKLFEPLRGQRDPRRTHRDHRRCLGTPGECREEFGEPQGDTAGDYARGGAHRMADPPRIHIRSFGGPEDADWWDLEIYPEKRPSRRISDLDDLQAVGP